LRQCSDTEHDRRNHDREAKHEVREEVREVETVLKRLARLPLEERHRPEVDAVHREQREQAEHRGKEPLQLRTNGRTELRHTRTVSAA